MDSHAESAIELARGFEQEGRWRARIHGIAPQGSFLPAADLHLTKGQRGDAVFAIARMVLSRIVIAVGNGSLVDVKIEKPCAAGDRLVDFFVHDAALYRQDHRQLADQPGLVQRAVAAELRRRICPSATSPLPHLGGYVFE